MAKIHLVVGTTIERARQAAKQLNLPNIREMNDLFGPEIKGQSEVAHLRIHDKIVENSLFIKNYKDSSQRDMTIIGVMQNWDFRRTHQCAPAILPFSAHTMWVERHRGHDTSVFVCKKHRDKGIDQEIQLSSVYMLVERFKKWFRETFKK